VYTTVLEKRATRKRVDNMQGDMNSVMLTASVSLPADGRRKRGHLNDSKSKRVQKLQVTEGFGIVF